MLRSTKTYEEVTEQNRRVNVAFRTFGCPALTDEVLADLAEWAEVPLNRVTTFALYGRIS